MYDSMLNFCSKGRVLSGDDAQLFLRPDKSQPEKLADPQVSFNVTTLNRSAISLFHYTEANSGLWWRIQDFRYHGLEKRVKEEKQRLVELTAEFKTLKRSEFLDPKKSSEGM